MKFHINVKIIVILNFVFSFFKFFFKVEQFSDFIHDCNDTNKKIQAESKNFSISFLEASEFAKHELDKIIKELNNGIKYKDNEFDAIDQSLFNDPNCTYNFEYYNKGKSNETKIEIKWLRPNEINLLETNRISNELNKDNILSRSIYRNTNADNLSQGELGDCWLIASLIVLFNHKDLLDKIFLASHSISQSKCLKHGCYALNLCINGIWETIIIDSRLPSRPDGCLKYVQTYKYQLWGSFIEKALAKYNRTYENLRSGTFIEGI